MAAVSCTYQCKAGGGGGRAWGGDLIVFVGPGVGHLTDLVLPGEWTFESFFARRGDSYFDKLNLLGKQMWLWLNPFAPEPQVTACGDTRPF